MSINYEKLKEKILLTSFEIVIFDGWSNKALSEAASLHGISKEDTKKIFPRGVIDLLKYYHQYDDDKFFKNLSVVDFNNLSHVEKIELALFKRFEIIIENKEAFKRSMALFSLPFNQIEGINLVFSTCDKIWVVIGDQSLSYDWYTKRITLSSVYLSSLLFLFGDNSTNHKDTFRFITSRLDDLKIIGQLKIKYSNLFDFFKVGKFKNH